MPVMRDKPLQSDSEESEVDWDTTAAWLDLEPEMLIKKLNIPANLQRESLLATFEPICKNRKFTNSVF